MRYTMALVVSTLIASTAWAQSEISVSAEAEVSAKPEISEFQFRIISREPLATDAFKDYLTTYNALINSLKKVTDTSKIMTANLSVTPSYNYKKPDQTRPDYYQVTAIMSISVPISDLNSTLERITSVEGVTISGIAFRAKDQDHLQLLALQEAVRKAREKADAIARLEGLGDLKVKTLNTAFARPPVPLYGMRAESLAAVPSINASDVTVSASVTVTYTAAAR